MNIRANHEVARDPFDAALRLHRNGSLEAAELAYREILKRQPRHPGALMGLGLVALRGNDAPQALALLEEARRLAPRDPAVLNNLGLALLASGREQEALAIWRRVLTIEPRFADALVNLANADARAGQIEGAISRYRGALGIDANSPSAAANLGGILVGRRRYSEAVHWLQRAAQLDRGSADVLINLGRAFSECGLARKAQDAFAKAISLRPGDPVAMSNLLMSLHYCDDIGAQEIAEAHRAWARGIEAAGVHERPAAQIGRPARFRIGLLSGDFNDHAVMRFLAPVLESHDNTRDELRCYYTGNREDVFTVQAREWGDAFVPVAGLSDDDLARRLRSDDLDLLLDLSGHSAGGRPAVLARRPAPLQASWLGYLDTTGLAEVDFRLTDAIMDPPGMTEELHTERLWRMTAMWCYRPREDSPAPGRAPCTAQPWVTFGSTNNPAKLSESTLSMWAEVLSGLPNSRIIIHAHDDPLCRERISRAFFDRAIAPERIAFLGREDARAYLQQYGEIDILLDTTPYSGGTTTCDALWMGVPVVTLAGSRPFSRTSASVLAAAGVQDWIAADREEYVRIARALAGDVAALAAWRGSLRTKVAKSRLCDEGAMVAELSAAFRSLWSAAGLPPRACQ